MTRAPFIDTTYLDAIDAGLAHMYAAACLHEWDWLPAYAEKVLEAGGTCQQIQASVRHLIVCVVMHVSILMCINTILLTRSIQENAKLCLALIKVFGADLLGMDPVLLQLYR